MCGGREGRAGNGSKMREEVYEEEGGVRTWETAHNYSQGSVPFSVKVHYDTRRE